jgi:glycosyltransferase involved in cell wall biosynthesis
VTGHPLLSFIVLSYNYERYIGQTIRSILDQTVQDFEIIVVDDASKDMSREVVAGFNEPRIRLLVNEQNLGGAGSYNRAILAARGEWLVNLDADDWILPQKSRVQLDALSRDPTLAIIGTHVLFVDADGAPHPRRAEMEAFTNHNLDLNRIDSWIDRNLLCRSSTMVRREAHLAVGLDDPTMVRGPDYELWTRALRHGCRIAVVPEPLTMYRLHARGVTHVDQLGTFLELSYAMLRNLVPLIEARALWSSFAAILTWVAGHEQLAYLTPGARYRLLGSMLMSPALPDFAGFVDMLQAEEAAHSPLAEAGRRCLALLRANPATERLKSDNAAFIGARDWWHDQADRWEAQSLEWKERSLRFEAQMLLQKQAVDDARANTEALEALAARRQFALDALQGRLAEAERKLRWTAANTARTVLSRFFRSS